MQKRLEKLVADIEKAAEAAHEGKRIDMRALDAESLAIARALKAKPDAALRPLLKQAVSALERLTATLEDKVTALKAKNPGAKKQG